VLEAVATQGVPVVKISGGEVMLIRGIMDFVEDLSTCYETVVILTNGLLLTEKQINRLCALGNVVLQISLDATCYQGNSYRVPSEKVQNALLGRIYCILRSGLPVEIYTVLNDRSIETLERTLDDLMPYADNDMCLFPFPVRGPTRARFLPNPKQYSYLRRVIDNAERYGSLLPNHLYLERLWRFFAEGGRTFRCHLPRVAFTAFDDGTITSCPNIWFNHVGNLINEAAAEVFQRLADTPFRKLLLAARPRLDACQGVLHTLGSGVIVLRG
jgi:MoaA/NifB/PqqE/SkfB family radical SAM enzyme